VQVPTIARTSGTPPGQHNIWEGGAYNVLSQAAIGSGYNLVSEFGLDILRAFGIKKE